MQGTSVFLILSIVLFASSCRDNQKEYIQEVDYQYFLQQTSQPGLTQTEFRNIYDVYQDSIENATLGKTIPAVRIANTSGDSLKLTSIIKDTSLIYVADAHCSFGLTGFRNDIPYIIKKFHKKNKPIDLICLLRRTENDQRFPGKFQKVHRELQDIYDKFWIIGDEEALRLNAWGTKSFLCDANGKVFYTVSGISRQGPGSTFKRMWKACQK